MAALDRARNRHLGPGAGPIEAGQLAGDARRIVVVHRVVELAERLLHPLLGRRFAGIDPDHTGLVDLHRIDAQAVAAIVVGAGPEVELPVVPVAGEDAAPDVERAFDEGIAFMRAAVVAGVDGAVVEKQGELLRAELDRGAARRAQAIELDRPGPGRFGFGG